MSWVNDARRRAEAEANRRREAHTGGARWDPARGVFINSAGEEVSDQRYDQAYGTGAAARRRHEDAVVRVTTPSNSHGVAAPQTLTTDPATGRPLNQPPPQPQQTAAQAVHGPPRTWAELQRSGGYAAAPAQSRAAPERQVSPGGIAGNAIDLSGQRGTSGVQVDYARYDQAAADLTQARSTFQSELDRLAGADPFGNQAFLQKATDRAVAQASGTAAMARGGAAALAGANRQAQGVQAQTAARGIQEMEQVKARDAQNAAGLRLQAAGGIAGVAGELAKNEIALGDQALRAGEANLQAAMQKYGIDAQIGQAERESLRQLGVAMSQVDMERYKTDVAYRSSVDGNIIAKYVSDNQLKGAMEQISAQENISTGEAIMGILGMGAGVAAGALKSDRRAKFDIRDPDLDDLKDYLGGTRGKLYRYKEPNKPGRKPGLNFGPMAQDLAKSKIGRTVLVHDADGQLSVDTGRLALADHAALASLAREVERLKGAKK